MSRIVVIDDDDDIRHALREILTQGGYDVACAASGREALDMLNSARAKPGLILLDLAMPEVSGWDVLQSLERDPSFASVPIALMSSHPSVRKLFERVTKDGNAEGARLLLPKPLNVLRLLDLVERVCAKASECVDSN
jgi:CheY-like chemotaxis protein